MVRGKDPAVAVARTSFRYVLAPARATSRAVACKAACGARTRCTWPAWPTCWPAARPGSRCAPSTTRWSTSPSTTSDLYLLTTAAPTTARCCARRWRSVVPRRHGGGGRGPLVIESIAMARDGLYVKDLDGGYHSVRKLGREGQAGRRCRCPGKARSSDVHQQRRRRRVARRLRLAAALHHLPPRPGPRPHRAAGCAAFDAGPRRLRGAAADGATARDGTRVPLSIVARKGLPRDGRNPTLVQAYGSYQISTNPYFSPRTWPSWSVVASSRWPMCAVAANTAAAGGRAARSSPSPTPGATSSTAASTWCANAGASQGHAHHPGRLGRRHHRGHGPDRAARPVCRRDQQRRRVQRAARRIRPERPAQHRRVRHRARRGRLAGLLAMDALQHVRDGTRYPGGAADHRHDRPARRGLAGRQDGGPPAEGQPIGRTRCCCACRFDAGHGLGSTRSQVDDERADEYAFALWRAGRKSVA
jgi:prolyl oligopeptidase